MKKLVLVLVASALGSSLMASESAYPMTGAGVCEIKTLPAGVILQARLLRHAQGLYQLSATAFLESDPSEIFRKIFNPALLPLLRFLPGMSPFQSLAAASRRFYRDPHLQQFLQRFATSNGSDPELTPATSWVGGAADEIEIGQKGRADRRTKKGLEWAV